MRIAPSQSLQADALRALEKGNHKKALRCFTALERLEPENGEWSLQVGLMYHRLGKRRHTVEALERAALRCHAQQHNERAKAIYKQILRFDPEHKISQRGLQSLEGPSLDRRAHRVAQQSIEPLKRVPASSSTFEAVVRKPTAPALATSSDVCGFGLPKSTKDRVALALASLKP